MSVNDIACFDTARQRPRQPKGRHQQHARDPDRPCRYRSRSWRRVHGAAAQPSEPEGSRAAGVARPVARSSRIPRGHPRQRHRRGRHGHARSRWSKWSALPSAPMKHNKSIAEPSGLINCGALRFEERTSAPFSRLSHDLPPKWCSRLNVSAPARFAAQCFWPHRPRFVQ